MLQETKLPIQCGKSIRGYSFIESTNNYGGCSNNTAMIIRDDIPFRNFNFLSNIRFTAIKVFMKKWYTLFTVYLPPNVLIDENYFNDFINRLPEPYIILGDFNGRHTLWNDDVCNTRGRIIERVISSHSISILNDESPTHIDPRTKTETIIDLSLCSTSITLDFNFQVDYDLHHSDHFPIILTSQVSCATTERPMKWQFSGADWSTFAVMSECSGNPDDFNQIDDMVEYFTTTVFNAANNCIKRSCGRINKKCVPWWNNDCKEALRHKIRA